jgi:hypothetical protein
MENGTLHFSAEEAADGLISSWIIVVVVVDSFQNLNSLFSST